MKKKKKNANKVIAFMCRDIDWDVDEKEDLKGLPKNKLFNKAELIRRGYAESADTDDDFEDSLADALSDSCGYCVNGFSVERIFA